MKLIMPNSSHLNLNKFSESKDVKGPEHSCVRGEMAEHEADHPEAAEAGGGDQGRVARPLLAGALGLLVG